MCEILFRCCFVDIEDGYTEYYEYIYADSEEAFELEIDRIEAGVLMYEGCRVVYP